MLLWQCNTYNQWKTNGTVFLVFASRPVKLLALRDMPSRPLGHTGWGVEETEGGYLGFITVCRHLGRSVVRGIVPVVSCCPVTTLQVQ